MENNGQISLPQLLKAVVDQGGSDLHLSVFSPPRIRLHGDLLALDLPPLSEQETQRLCYSVMSEEQRNVFEEENEMDLAFSVKGLARFRGNIFRQRTFVGGVFRLIPSKIKTVEELGLPQGLLSLCGKPRGLVLVTGPTGSGKSTTLAALIDHINAHEKSHIITVEDPIEFIHPHKKCLINQRELGTDTKSFSKALKSALRQDPDVILVGELRDMETTALALTAAETGHLVFATMHTNSCIATINRIIDAFPAAQQSQIRAQVSLSLIGVISQLLIPSTDNKRVCVMEIMYPNHAIRSQIRDDKIHQVYSSMQVGQDVSGMQTMNQSLLGFVQKKKLTPEMAVSSSSDPGELEAMMVKLGLIRAVAKGH